MYYVILNFGNRNILQKSGLTIATIREILYIPYSKKRRIMPIVLRSPKWHDVRNRFKYPINWLRLLIWQRNILAEIG